MILSTGHENTEIGEDFREREERKESSVVALHRWSYLCTRKLVETYLFLEW
jgi:hypothetical protein